tara:strand:- start:6133 stop:6750 length:618 start_codon:yes stop_codon:yes gene_type:complete
VHVIAPRAAKIPLLATSVTVPPLARAVVGVNVTVRVAGVAPANSGETAAEKTAIAVDAAVVKPVWAVNAVESGFDEALKETAVPAAGRGRNLELVHVKVSVSPAVTSAPIVMVTVVPNVTAVPVIATALVPSEAVHAAVVAVLSEKRLRLETNVTVSLTSTAEVPAAERNADVESITNTMLFGREPAFVASGVADVHASEVAAVA